METFEPSIYSIKLNSLLKKKKEECLFEEQKITNSLSEKWKGNSVRDIFEEHTGGILCYDYEIPNVKCALSKLFFSTSNNSSIDSLPWMAYCKNVSFLYSFPTDNGFILRGPSVYYYLVCEKEKNGRYTDDLLLSWKEKCICFLDFLGSALDYDINNNSEMINSAYYCKLLLGALDNVRNLVLISINSKINRIVYDCGVALYDADDAILRECIIIKKVYDMILHLLFSEKSASFIVSDFSSLIHIVRVAVSESFDESMKKKYESIRYLMFRVLREADNFIENYMVLSYAARRVSEELLINNKELNLCGILSGGCELTIIMQYILTSFDIQMSFVVLQNDYLSRHNECGGIIELTRRNEGDGLRRFVLVDDNVMTGRSLEKAEEIITTDCFGCVVGNVILRHPLTNRIAQIISYGYCLDVDFLENSCIGLLTPSPYTRIRIGSNIENEYLDECGTFTLTGEFFLRYLYKNGLYSNNSEVDYYRTYNKRRVDV